MENKINYGEMTDIDIKKEDIVLTEEWDKTFSKSEKVNHRKVTFNNRFGITLVADLYEPKEYKGKLSGVAVAGPFGAVKEQAISTQNIPFYLDRELLEIVALFLRVKIFSEMYWQNVIKCYTIIITVNNSKEESYEYNNK